MLKANHQTFPLPTFLKLTSQILLLFASVREFNTCKSMNFLCNMGQAVKVLYLGVSHMGLKVCNFEKTEKNKNNFMNSPFTVAPLVYSPWYLNKNLAKVQ